MGSETADESEHTSDKQAHTGQENATLPVGLTHFQTQQGTQWNYIMAGAALSMLPGIVLAILLQKLIYNSIALNAGMGGR